MSSKQITAFYKAAVAATGRSTDKNEEHSARITGAARRMKRAKVVTLFIQVFGRWGPQMVLHYLKDSVLDEGPQGHAQEGAPSLADLERKIESILASKGGQKNVKMTEPEAPKEQEQQTRTLAEKLTESLLARHEQALKATSTQVRKLLGRIRR